MELKKLFEPIQIGNMHVKNRILMSPMGTNMGVEEGHVTAQLRDYFVARAKGGAGMILVGGGGVHPQGLVEPRLPALYDDQYLPSLRKFTEAVHDAADVKFGMQLLHGGRQANLRDKVAPSPIPSLAVVKGMPTELTLDNIEELAQVYFGGSARRCMEAGFDFVEIHAAHGYLINQFLSPISNEREDQYGGSLDNRVRFLLECLKAIKESTGGDFPVGVRINGEDYVKNGGLTLDQTAKIAPMLEENGADYIHVSFGIYGASRMTIPSMYEDEGTFVYLAEGVKKEVSIPVIAVGAIKSPLMAEQILRDNRADVISMGRALIADPELPNKAREGRIREIRPCIGCCQGCAEMVMKAVTDMSCVVNPLVGREWSIKTEPAKEPKKLLVIGSGPAGLETATVASARGHKVIVCEKSGQIGGQLILAAVPPKRSNFLKLVDYYAMRLNENNVEIRLNVEVNEKVINEISPDEIIVATGSLPRIPEISGLFDCSMDVVLAGDILSGDAIPGDNIFIIGGQRYGLLTADYLAERAKKLMVIENSNHLVADLAANDRWPLMTRLRAAKVTVNKNSAVKEIKDDTIIAVIKGEEVQLTGYDQIIIADTMKPNRDILNTINKIGIPLHVIGDAKEPRGCFDAVAEANETAHAI